MNKLATVVIFLFLLTFSSFAEKVDYLFVNTTPIRAKIIIDDNDTKLLTPCILKGDQLNNKAVVIEKEGYRRYLLSKKDLGKKSLRVNLVPSSFDLYFPEKTTYKIGTTEFEGPVYVTKLKPGKYDISVSGSKLQFIKSSPFAVPEAALGTTLGLSFVGMVSSIILSEYFAAEAYSLSSDKDSDNYKYYTRTVQNLDILKGVLIGTTAALGVAVSSVVITDIVTQVKNKKESMEIINKSPSNQDELFYSTAIQFLASGEIDRSTKLLLSIISLFPESNKMPLVHYQLGQNYFILQDYENAKKYWDIFIRDYPLAEYFDYVIKNLADLYYTQKMYKEARFTLDRVLFTDNVITSESIYSLRAKIDYERYLESKSDEFLKIAEAEYMELLQKFPNSERMDVYFLILVELYKSVNATDKIVELKKKAEAMTKGNESMRNLVLSHFE